MEIKKERYTPSIKSKMSHELKIGLTGITGMIHFLKDTKLSKQQEKYIELLQISTNRLLNTQSKFESLAFK